LLERVGRIGASAERSEARVREEILTLIERELVRRVRRRCGSDDRLDEAVGRVESGADDPYSAAESILESLELET
jgi:putative protein kinase ArgK-like GTPase of G3E family